MRAIIKLLGVGLAVLATGFGIFSVMYVLISCMALVPGLLTVIGLIWLGSKLA